MQLSLKYEAEPENAIKFADDIVQAAEEVSNTKLDYTPESLKLVDEQIEAFRKQSLKTDDIATTLFGFGCYVGEVIVRNYKGVWNKSEAANQKNITGMPLVIDVGSDSTLNPIGKVFKRFENGEEDSLEYFYQVVMVY